jgi:hypothetical protein
LEEADQRDGRIAAATSSILNVSKTGKLAKTLKAIKTPARTHINQRGGLLYRPYGGALP